MKLGARHSKETKEKMRKVRLGKKQSEETREKISNALLGHEVSKEARKKISNALRAKISAKERFWTKVDKSQGADSCWPWLRRLTYGYGRIRWMGTPQQAHRVAWQIEHGTIPQGLCVLHHCDNPSCVNPLHLFLGTHADNVQDKVNKNRQARGADLHAPKGEDHSGSKLTEKDVREIRNLAASGISQEKIAKRAKLTPQYVHKIINRKSRKHI